MKYGHVATPLNLSEHPRQVLKNSKLRVTPWRKRLVSILLADARPLSRAEIGERLSGFDLPIAASTLQYLIEDFVAAGILEKIRDERGTALKYKRTML